MSICFYYFFFNDTATTEIYTLSLHDALPICVTAQQHTGRAYEEEHQREEQVIRGRHRLSRLVVGVVPVVSGRERPRRDRKSTRLNSSHANISYAVFCLKKKKKHQRR